MLHTFQKSEKKEKLSITVRPALRQAIVEYQEQAKLSSVSEAFELLAENGLRHIQQLKFEEDVAIYYRDLSGEEQAERADWLGLSSNQFFSGD